MKRRPPPATKREIQLEADRMRRTNAPLDTRWYVLCGELAQALSLKPSGVLEMFAEMAHCYTYDGTDRADAEQRAWRDTVDILEAIASGRERHAA